MAILTGNPFLWQDCNGCYQENLCDTVKQNIPNLTQVRIILKLF